MGLSIVGLSKFCETPIFEVLGGVIFRWNHVQQVSREKTSGNY